MKPMLASDYDPSKLVFPLIAQPKIDGVRCININGVFTGRSLKGHKNKYITERFSQPALSGLDGEAAAWYETAPDLCRRTSKALSTIEGKQFITWWLFDFLGVNRDLVDRPYSERLDRLVLRHVELAELLPDLWSQLRIIPWKVVETIDQLVEVDTQWLLDGFEGTIIRSPDGAHKEGRSTVREGGLLRIKRFVDFEFMAYGIIEGDSNQNTIMINPLGRTERSSHAENMVPNGMVGTILGIVLNDVVHEGKLLFKKDDQVRVAPGCLTHDQRRYYFTHQEEFFSNIHKAKLFPLGIKDMPRFPTWQTFRNPEDMN